jgi:lysophospholipase L1-like esterase
VTDPVRPAAWTGLIALSMVALLAGCGSDSGNNPAPAPGPISSSAVSYTAIGASDAIGIGSSSPCVPFTSCPDGRGYVPSVARELERRGSTVTLTNLGVPAAVLAPSIQQLGNQYGRGIPANFEEQEGPFVPQSATLVTIFAGGNDTNAVATAIDRGGAGSDVGAFIDRQIQDFGSSYNRLVDLVRNRAPKARIVSLNLPNFASLPYTARYTAEQKQWMRRISVGFSRAANGLTSKGVVVVDLLCDDRSYDGGNYSSDGFHPNDAGYAFLTELIVQAATSNIGAPRSDCPAAHVGE